MFDMPAPPPAQPQQPQGSNLSRLYGSTATQYINEMLLQGSAQSKLPGAAPLPDGKKPVPGKHGDGTGKQWQYPQQVSFNQAIVGHAKSRYVTQVHASSR